jgi:hypothetical protein
LCRSPWWPPCICPYIGRVLLIFYSFLSMGKSMLSYWKSGTWPNFYSYIMLT